MKFIRPAPPPIPEWVLDQATPYERYKVWATEHGVTVLAVIRARRAFARSKFTSTTEEGDSK